MNCRFGSKERERDKIENDEGLRVTYSVGREVEKYIWGEEGGKNDTRKG